ncbi:MAG: spore coat protein U domain-containing protein [Usitatibacter sp.]
MKIIAWLPAAAFALADATRTGVWGDGAGSTGTVSGSGTFANHTVHGRIPPRQNVQARSYSDLIIVTVTF